MKSSRKQVFRNQIRRKQMQEMFAIERRLHNEQQITQQNKQLKQYLANQDHKIQWISNQAKMLTGQPNQFWLQTLRDLSKSVQMFNRKFDIWFKYGILEKLAFLLKRNIDDGLSQLAASVMSDVIFNFHPQSQIDKILQYEFIMELVQLCTIASDATQYYFLIQSMINKKHQIRDKFIDNGLVQNLIHKLKNSYNYQTDETFTAFGLILRLISIYEVQNFKFYPKRNVCLTLIPVLEKYLVSVQRNDTMFMIYRCIEQLTQLNSLPIYSVIANSPYILKKTLSSLCLENYPHIRYCCVNILVNYLYSPKRQHAEEIYYLGFLDYMHKCIQVENLCPGDKIRMPVNILLALLNFAASGEKQCISLFQHSIFPFVIEMSHESQPLKIKFEALYVLGTLISSQNFSIIDKLVNQYKLLQIFVLNLNIPSQEIVCEILNGLIKLIMFYDNIYTGKVNKITDMLERFYNINMVLKELENTQNKKINKRITVLIAKMNGQ